MNAEFAAFMAEYDGGNGAGPAPDPESEEATPELVPPDNTVLALAAAPVVNQCTATTKRKKRCKNKVKKGSTNGLCSVHQPSPEPASSSSEEILDESESSDSEREWCEVGEHWVDPEDMWSDSADCQKCVSEKEYLEHLECIAD